MDPITTLIVNLKESGFPLILLWLLTLSIVYGILSHVEIPKSISARGVIAIVSSFMVLFAAAATPAVAFIENLITVSVVIAFGLMMAMIFLEITGTKKEGEHIFAKHPTFFAAAILILLILIFIGAGGLELLNLPTITLTNPMLAILFFLVVMIMAVWILIKETGGK
jgi:hypothetical protein